MTTTGDALTGRDARRARERLLELAARDLPPAELFARADQLLRAVIPFEREVLALVAQGLSIDAIARRLVISLHTARDHVKRIRAKVRVTSRAELVSKLYVEHCAPAVA